MNITDLHQIRASTVPAVPKEITASQRLAALELAQRCEDYGPDPNSYVAKMLDDCARLLREIAR
jgi:hypothetical protein